MKKQISIALAAGLLMGGVCTASAATMQAQHANMTANNYETSSGKLLQPKSITPRRNEAQNITYFNKQGTEKSKPTHFAELWGDAALGG